VARLTATVATSAHFCTQFVAIWSHLVRRLFSEKKCEYNTHLARTIIDLIATGSSHGSPTASIAIYAQDKV